VKKLLLLFLLCGLLRIPAVRAVVHETVALSLAERYGKHPLRPEQTADEEARTKAFELKMKVSNVYQARKEYENAVRALLAALELSPGNDETLFSLGSLLIQLKDYSEAKQIFTHLISVYPDDYRMYNNLAWLFATAEDPLFRNGPEAERLAQHALMLAPLDHHVWSTLAEARLILGDYSKAVRSAGMAYNIAAARQLPEQVINTYAEQFNKCLRAETTIKILEEMKLEKQTGESER